MSHTEIFDYLPCGQPVHRHWLQQGSLRVAVLSYGATIQDLRLQAVDHPLVLGARRLAPYQHNMCYFGANVGRVANRIANGRARIGAVEVPLQLGHGEKHLLHGGAGGIHRQLWQIIDADDAQITLGLSLADGHMGFPGKLDIRLNYRIVAPATLQLTIEATTDASTLCNIAHHSYFNLDGSADILNHRLQIEADEYLPVDAEQIPTGEIAAVAGSRFDFTRPRPLRSGHPHQGYDHNFCLAREVQPLRRAASLHSPKSGLRLHLHTTEPGLQVYDGAHIRAAGAETLSAAAYGAHAGVALEPQRWPDAPHHPGFPSIALDPGELYRQTTCWSFERQV